MAGGKKVGMQIKISSITQIPIYEQIEIQIKEMIMAGMYTPGTQLPSIRILARELKVGIITCRRAYDDLCAQGILVSQPGKGVFVANIQMEHLKNINMELLTDQLKGICEFARASGISRSELIENINAIYNKKEE
ncbi:GntR family transcriptional regulator [[Clostridium] fimetarium]|uniref:GntR family transcriptional regulator n=2 Tax=[Clostridium] fimetarium TaxID=99656 RepID=A0A1I0P836_9FIRM|nr:GntR family transcriptional regulator [[Clostridium] fimetarium]